jgi:protein-S-isoprenylcysteine O-methyltransferase Ste14
MSKRNKKFEIGWKLFIVLVVIIVVVGMIYQTEILNFINSLTTALLGLFYAVIGIIVLGGILVFSRRIYQKKHPRYDND